MLIVTTMPTKGQFIAVWQYGGDIWSSTICWDDGVLYVFLPLPGAFTPLTPDHPVFTASIHYLIREEYDEDIPDVSEDETVH